MRSVFFCERWGLSIATIMLICCGIQPGLISSTPTAPTGTLVRRMVGVGDASKLKPLTPSCNFIDTPMDQMEKFGKIDEHLKKLPAEEQVPFRNWLYKQAEDNNVPIEEQARYHWDDFSKHLEAWRTSKEETRRASSAFLDLEVFENSYLHELKIALPDFFELYLPANAEFRRTFEDTLPSDFKTPQIKTGAEFLKKYQSYAKDLTKNNRQMAQYSFIEEYLPEHQRLRTAFLGHLQDIFKTINGVSDPQTEAPVTDLMSAYLLWVMEFDVPQLGVPETAHYVNKRLVRASRENDDPVAYQNYYRPPFLVIKPDGNIETIPERLFSTGLGDPKLQHAFYRTLPKIAAIWEKRQTELNLGEVHDAFRQFATRRRKANPFKKVYYKIIDLMHRFKDCWKKMSFYEKLSTSLNGMTIGALATVVF